MEKGLTEKNLKYLLIPQKVNLITIVIFIKIGSMHDPEKQSGIAHFAEHLLFLKKINNKSVSQIIEEAGGNINASTSINYTSYYITIDKSKSKLALNVLSKMLTFRNFGKSDFNAEKKVIIEEIYKNMNNPEEYIEDFILVNTFSGTQYANLPLGKIKDVNNLSNKDIISFLDKYYTINNMLISVCGGFKKQSLINNINKYFKDIPNANKNIYLHIHNPIKSTLKIQYKNVNQTNIGFGIKFNDVQNIYIYNLIKIILGSGMTSRLFETLRNKHGLSYSTYADVYTYNEMGIFLIFTAVKSDQSSKAIKLCKNEIKKMQMKGVTYKELEKAKNIYCTNIYKNHLNPLNKNFFFGEDYLFGKYKIKNPVNIIKNINLKDINNLCSTFFKNDIHISIVGKYGNKNSINTIY